MAAVQQPPMSGATVNSIEGVDLGDLLNFYNQDHPQEPITMDDLLSHLNFPDLPDNNNNINIEGLGDDGGDDDLADEDDEFQDAWEEAPNSARARQAAEALRQSKTVHNPVRPGADSDVDADGVALGVVPDREGRRWRERRMRLARYALFLADGPAVDDADVPPPLARFLDLEFEREEALTAAPVVSGGRARGCMGAYVGGRPAPRGVELRRRREGPVGVAVDEDDLRALDLLYEGIGTPPPLQGQAGQQRGGAVPGKSFLPVLLSDKPSTWRDHRGTERLI